MIGIDRAADIPAREAIGIIASPAPTEGNSVSFWQSCRRTLQRRDIAPVAGISRTPAVLTVTPSFPAKIVPDFISYARANPGKITLASGGIGSLPHVAGELFKFMTGINLVHVPYRGS